MIMKRKSSLPCDKPQIIKREKCLNLIKSVAPFLLCSFGVTLIFTFFVLYPPNPYKSPPKHPLNQNNLFLHSQRDEEEKCDLFKGHWVPELNGSLYTNSSCVSIPESKNCLKNGRMDRDFLNWRWKPDECTLERFDPKIFFSIVRGKKMAFIGDSVARNHIESLLCLLSKEEIPVNVYEDTEDRFRTWHFPFHDFTLMILWSKFLVTAEERLINGSNSGVFDLHLDMVDKKWAQKLPIIDYAIISDGHWFFRKIYLYQGGALTGCIYCNEPNLTDRGLGYALKKSFRIALAHINACKECEGMVTFLRTFSPAHFENGSWDSGGSCNRTSPIPKLEEVESSGFCLDIGKIQVEEIERARKIQEKQRGKKRFEVLDVTMATLMRGDGHPGAYWGNKWMKGYNDCVHWCLPGPIDVWNDFLMAMLRKKRLGN